MGLLDHRPRHPRGEPGATGGAARARVAAVAEGSAVKKTGGASVQKGPSYRRRVFAARYAIHGNATVAAKEAGYAHKAAGQQGYWLLRDPQVSALVEAERQRLAAELEITPERTLATIAAIAYSDSRELVEVVDGRVIVRDTASLSKGAALSIRAIRARVARKRGRPGKVEGEPEGDEIVEISVTREPRLEALRLLAETQQGLLKPRGIDLTSGGMPLMGEEPRTVEEAAAILQRLRGKAG